MSSFINDKAINFREKLSSDKHNDKMKGFTDDLLNLNVKLETMENVLDEKNKINYINEKALKNSVHELSAKLETVTTQYEQLKNNSVYKELYIHSSKFENSYASGENTSYIDKDSNVATLNFNYKENKLIIKDDLYDEVFIPLETSIFTEFKVDGDFTIVEEKDTNNIITPGEVYYSRIKTDRSVSEVILDLKITLPESIINNNNLNAIIAEAFPYNNVDIVSIEYKNLGENKIIDVLKNHPMSEDYVFENYTYDAIKNSKREMFNFPKIKTSEVTIKLRQGHYEDELNDRYFYIGIRDLQLVNLNYENDTSTFYTIVEFNTGGEKTIHSIKPIINNPNYCNQEDVKLDLSYLDALNNTIPIKENFPLKISNNKFMIKTTLFKNLTSPSVSGFDIQYTKA